VLRSRFPFKLPEYDLLRPGVPWDAVPGGGITEVYDTLTTAIDGAQRWIYIEDQYLGDSPLGPLPAEVAAAAYSIMPNLLAAVRRGVKLIMVGSGKNDGDPPPFALVNQDYDEAGDVRSGITDILDAEAAAAGTPSRSADVAVWRMDILTVHSKLCLIDDAFAAIGSANIHSRSMYGNDSELHIAVVSDGDWVTRVPSALAEHLASARDPARGPGDRAGGRGDRARHWKPLCPGRRRRTCGRSPTARRLPAAAVRRTYVGPLMGADPLIPLDEWLDARVASGRTAARGWATSTSPARLGPAGVSFEVLVGRELGLHPPGIGTSPCRRGGTPGRVDARRALVRALLASPGRRGPGAARAGVGAAPVDPPTPHTSRSRSHGRRGHRRRRQPRARPVAVRGYRSVRWPARACWCRSGARLVTPATAARRGALRRVFSGLYLDDVTVEVPGLPAAVAPGAWTTCSSERRFSGHAGAGGHRARWDAPTSRAPTRRAVRFKAGSARWPSLPAVRAHRVSRCAATFPAVSRARIGLALGIAADGSLTATAGLPATADPGVGAGSGTHLVELDLAGVLRLALDQVSFALPAGGPAVVELTGEVELTLPAGTIDLDVPPIGLRALRIDSDGNVPSRAAAGIARCAAVSLSGFTLEITRLGFGRDATARGSAERRREAGRGPADGASVEGLKVTIRPGRRPPGGRLGHRLELEVPVPFRVRPVHRLFFRR